MSPMRRLIPNRPKKKAAYYRSREYKNQLRLKFYKWSHLKAAKVYYSMWNTRYNPYATDWFGSDRQPLMQKRAEAMFDSMLSMLKIRMDQVPDKTRRRAVRYALGCWAEAQQEVDGRAYRITDSTILPVRHPQDKSKEPCKEPYKELYKEPCRSASPVAPSELTSPNVHPADPA